MKKVLSLAMAAVMVCMSVAGCNSGPNQEETKAQKESGGTEASGQLSGVSLGTVENPEDQTYLWCSYESTDDFMLMVYEGFEDCGKIPSLTVRFRKTPWKSLFYIAFPAVLFRFTI